MNTLVIGNVTISQPYLLNQCANCLVFNWDQPDELFTLKKCKQCKVLEYCSESCQKEHWRLVHKKHCKNIANQRDEDGSGGDWPFSIYSHHPFSATKVPCDPVVALVMLSHKIVLEMNHKEEPAYTKVTSQLDRLERELIECLMTAWANRKIFPEKITWKNYKNDILDILNETENICSKDLVMAPRELWHILHLVLGRLSGCRFLQMLNNFKDQQESVPQELWNGLQKEVGVFPVRTVALIKALSGDQIPSFGELLQVFCGGTLSHTCSFCRVEMIVLAVNGEFVGGSRRVPSVSIMPFQPQLFSCGAELCDKAIVRGEDAYRKMWTGLSLTHLRLRPSMCDYCFLLAEKVHRCSKCLTKTYCSRQCLSKDWEEKHSDLCQEESEERKVKGDFKARLKAGSEDLECGMKKALRLADEAKSERVKEGYLEVNRLCQEKDKAKIVAKKGSSKGEKDSK